MRFYANCIGIFYANGLEKRLAYGYDFSSVKRRMTMRFLIVVLMCSPFMLYGGTEESREIQLRIQPIGQVSVEKQSNSKHKLANSVIKTEAGQKIYEQHCIVCHGEGLAGAPKFRNEHDWKPRLADKTLNDLLASSIKGLNAMPEKGTCLKCSDEELKAALSYMLPQS
jgi:cytochrome c5